MRAASVALALLFPVAPSAARAEEQDFLFLGDTAFLQERGLWQMALSTDLELDGSDGEQAGAEAAAELEYGITDEIQIAALIPYRFESRAPDRLGAFGLELAGRIVGLGPDGHVIAALALETPELEGSGGAWRAGPGVRASKAVTPQFFVHAAGAIRFDLGRDRLPERTSAETSAAAIWRPVERIDLILEGAWAITRARGSEDDEGEATVVVGAVNRFGEGWWIGSGVAVGLKSDQAPARLFLQFQAEW